jgi:5-methylcytosine-specific restriction endonuclease McrA
VSLITFRKQEAAYFEWLNAHPTGFVLNTRASLSPEYMMLHRGSCKFVTGYLGKAGPGGFTERSYRKVCAETVAPIKVWVSSNGGHLSTCSHCGPEEDELTSYHRALYADAKEALGDDEARRKRLAVAPKKPATATVSTTVYLRNPDVVAEVLKRAKGKCERCGCKAPFLRKDGSPYLEVHHLKPLASEGEDTVANAQAQCPNCHREAHFGAGGTDG